MTDRCKNITLATTLLRPVTSTMSVSLRTQTLLLPANEVCEGYVFTRVCQSFCSGGGEGGVPACSAGGIPAYLAGLGGGVVSQHALQVSRPTPRREVEGSGLGGLQAHTQGGLQAHTLGGVSRPTPSGVSQHALRQTPHPPADGYCHGCYASCWNAFLLHNLIIQVHNAESTSIDTQYNFLTSVTLHIII